MTKNIVIVESPAKSKTISKYLGKDFKILASYGHVRDLIAKDGAVNPDEGFSMNYQLVERNIKHITVICKALKSAENLYLATDPDREGEAIAWHIFQILQEKGALKNKGIHRISFHQITKNAVQEAVNNPHSIDMNLVNSQQTRRALDHLVGFHLSPLLWKKVQRGLSAGRVQSPALRLIAEREQEIQAFENKEYWTITADCHHDEDKFNAKLINYKGEKQEQFSITNEETANTVKDTLLKASNGILIVDEIKEKKRKRNPAAPFITSTLQQEAARKLGFSAKRTMQVAQQLYEGINVGDGEIGLITYMRTDSVNLASEAVAEIRDFISQHYGKENLPDNPRVYKTKSKNAQEAHEAIRPTSIMRNPKELESFFTKDQYKLYSLIWMRTLASQMIHATLNTTTIDLVCGENNRFRSTGSVIVHRGFMVIYQEGEDDVKNSADKKEIILPILKKGAKVDVNDILCEQHFTEPPPRYSEASLIKTLEEYGIGRPSTYAAIVSTLIQRNYAILNKKRFYPTDIGVIVNRFLTKYFTKYVDYNFTANLEGELDAISRGEMMWISLLEKFWKPFKNQIEDIEHSVQRKDVTSEAIDKKCPKCGGSLSIRLGRNGRFIGCDAYPDCNYTSSLEEDKEGASKEIVEGRVCPECKAELQIRTGRYGKFIGCSNYPKCKYIESLNKPIDTNISCPECREGSLLKRKSKRGKIFYSCSKYPDCQYALWNEPVEKPCPKCYWPIITIKVTKSKGEQKVCPKCKHQF